MVKFSRRLCVSALALCASLCSQDFSSVTVEKVAGGFRFTEGPVWSREGYLLFSDIPNDKIMKYIPGEAPSVFR